MRSIDPQEIVREARSWVGTPYRHQGQLRARAVDCVGLIIGVGKALDILTMTADSWREFAAYSRTPNPARMGLAMKAFLRPLPIPKEEAAPDGSIAWMAWREGLPMHLAIMATFEGRRTMIHAYSHAGRCVEHGFVSEWPGRVVSWWAYPGRVGASAGAAPDEHHKPGNPD